MGNVVNLDEHRRRKEYLELVAEVAAERAVKKDAATREALLRRLKRTEAPVE